MKKIVFLVCVAALSACSKDEPDVSLKSAADGLVSYYPLDNDATDKGPNAINGTIEGAVAAPDRNGKSNSAFYFDGDGDYIKVSNTFRTRDMQTIAFWVKFNEMKVGGPSMEMVSKSSQRQGIEVLIHEDKLKFFIMGKEESNSVGIPVTELNAQEWIFVTTVYDYQEKEMRLYVNGLLKDTNWAPASVTEIENLMFGNWNYEAAPRYFNGYLDDVKIYNRPLAETEVADLFTQGH